MIVAVLVITTPPPVTIPIAEPMFAMPVALLLHVPPAVASLNVVVRPEHMLRIPRIPVGNGLTVTILYAIAVPQLLVTVYSMESTPGVTPVKWPVLPPIIATDVLMLVHMPPGDTSVKVTMLPTQTLKTPAITPALG